MVGPSLLHQQQQQQQQHQQQQQQQHQHQLSSREKLHAIQSSSSPAPRVSDCLECLVRRWGCRPVVGGVVVVLVVAAVVVVIVDAICCCCHCQLV